MSTPPAKIRPTQKDIAKALGLSQAAVAIALNPRSQDKLLPQTVAMVQAKALEMNYSPQRQASILRSGRSHTIGVVFTASSFHNPQATLRDLALNVIAKGYQLVATDLSWFRRDYKKAADYLMGAAAEGVILCDLPIPRDFNWQIFQPGWPILCLRGDYQFSADHVNNALAEGFYQMTRHHLDTGSRKLTLLLPFYSSIEEVLKTGSSRTIHERVEGFRRAIEDAGGEVITAVPETASLFGLPKQYRRKAGGIRGEVIYTPKTDAFENVFELGAYHVRRMLAENGTLPDSLICSNDDVAFGALGACLRSGVRIPEDVKISGADDAPMGRYCSIPMTTLAQPWQEMTAFCIDRLVNVIEDRQLLQTPIHREFPCQLIIRESTAGAASNLHTV